jgi:excisionase family DNA binding protein
LALNHSGERCTPQQTRSTMENISFEKLPEAVSVLLQKVDNLERLFTSQTSVQSNPEDELLSVDQCAEFLNLSKPTIYGLTSKGELPFMKRSKRCYFSKNELLEYLKQGRKKTNRELLEEPVKPKGKAKK